MLAVVGTVKTLMVTISIIKVGMVAKVGMVVVFVVVEIVMN